MFSQSQAAQGAKAAAAQVAAATAVAAARKSAREAARVAHLESAAAEAATAAEAEATHAVEAEAALAAGVAKSAAIAAMAVAEVAAQTGGSRRRKGSSGPMDPVTVRVVTETASHPDVAAALAANVARVQTCTVAVPAASTRAPRPLSAVDQALHGQQMEVRARATVANIQ